MTLDADAEIRFGTRPIAGVEPSVFLLDGSSVSPRVPSHASSGPVDTNTGKRWVLHRMLKATDDTTDREEAIFSVPENHKITQDFGRETVLDLSMREFEYKNHMMPTERLPTMMTGCTTTKITGEVVTYVIHTATLGCSGIPSGKASFNSYMLPVINLTKRTPKEAVCTVFEKVNTGGVVLTVFELVTLVRRRRICPSR